ncbi:MAG TPA: tyrosine-type recombinase/integrase [Microvirga sp.]|jgi:integrase
MPTIHLTKRSIDALPYPQQGQVIYRDQELRGFGLRVGSRTKVFIAEGQVGRRTVRTTLGRYGLVTPEQARKLALQTLSRMGQGEDPNAKKVETDVSRLTLRHAFTDYFRAKPSLSLSTRSNYQRTVDTYLADWADRPIGTVSRAMVLQRHQQLIVERGAMTANAVMRHLRAVYNFVQTAHDDTLDLPPNPVGVLSKARQWAPERRRQGVIPQHLLPAWYQTVIQEAPLARDFLLMALLTGMRRREIAGLRWENIDLVGRTLTVPKTKNGDSLRLPLSPQLVRLLEERRGLVGSSPWVFPTGSRHGHLQEVKSFVARVGARCGHRFTVHDLRRTFITIAEAIGTPTYTLKRLLNHRTAGDVTAGYIVMDVERLRRAMDEIHGHIAKLLFTKPFSG